MTNKSWLVIILFSIISQIGNSQGFCDKVDLMYSVFERFHVEQKTVDTAFEKRVREQFLQDLDPYNFVLAKEDHSQLLLVPTDCDFVKAATTLYSARVQEFDSISTKLLASKLDLKVDDKLELYDNISGSVTKFKRANRIEKVIKFMVLKDLYFEYDYVDKNFFELPNQMEAQNEVSKFLSVRISRKSASFDERLDRFQEKFLNAIGHQFDPHSGYFSVNKKEAFEESLSKEVTSFGVSFGEDGDGTILINSLMPGGAAWKTGEVHIGDVVLELKIGDETSKKTTSMSSKKANVILKSGAGKTVVLVLKSEDGQVNKVSLKEETTEVESNVISSFILEEDKKIGYIELPGFYTDFGGLFGLGCANDVAKELMKLKKEGVDGVILDLRYNGGGSLKEALDLAGIFIDEGPFIVLNKVYDKPRVSKDRNRGSIYSGPLTVMVNGASASASEILSKIFQDYNRALIVGGTTYGKATAQNIIPLDTSSYTKELFPRGKPDTDLGYTKITLSKIYGVDLKTYQKKGISPDVQIPFYYDGLIDKESEEPTALSNDEVKKNIYNFSPLPNLPIAALKDSSDLRVKEDSIFIEVKKLNAQLKVVYGKFESGIPISLKSYIALLEERKNLEMKIEALDEALKVKFKVKNTEFEKEVIKLSEYSQERNERIRKALSQDVELNEAFQITQDLINTNK